MPTNIEIKARLPDRAAVENILESLGARGPEVLHQEDVFFNNPAGRLKLRTLAPDRGELIYYERADTGGPKASRYEITRTPEPAALRALLTAALGTRGTVRKVRTLYLLGRTRVHLDRVEGLGDYVELEVVLADGDIVEDGTREADALMARLGISEADLVVGAYIDLLVTGTATSHTEG